MCDSVRNRIGNRREFWFRDCGIHVSALTTSKFHEHTQSEKNHFPHPKKKKSPQQIASSGSLSPSLSSPPFSP